MHRVKGYMSYVLMACICKDDDGESCECRHAARPRKDSDCSAIRKSVASDVVCDDQYNEVCNREQGDDASVLERVETT